MPTTPSDDDRYNAIATEHATFHEPNVRRLDLPRVRAAAALSYARALVRRAEEELMEHVAMATREFDAFAASCSALDALADTLMEPHNVAQVLQTVEEIAGDTALPHQHTLTLASGQVFVTRHGREQILSAIVDARQEALEEEEEEETRDAEPDYDAEPGDHRAAREAEEQAQIQRERDR